VYSSGLLGQDNHVDKNAYFYRALVVDRSGDPVWKHDLFNMVGDSYKNFIPAGGADVVNYSFKIPFWVKSSVTVTATVRYRKLNQKYAEWALKQPNIKLPIIDLSRSSVTIPIRKRPEIAG